MDAPAFIALTVACAPQVDTTTALALVRVESDLNPWAIGVVGGALIRQPRSRSEALSTARALRESGWNFSVGLSQINVRNLTRLGLTLEGAFEPCANLAAMQSVLTDCIDRARAPPHAGGAEQIALRNALSCYYSGSFTVGYHQGYVRKVVSAAAGLAADAGRARHLAVAKEAS